jgi:ChrR Cupin-like domain
MSPTDITIVDMNTREWRATAHPGLWLKPVREDAELGQYLGLVRFDPDVRSGLHQHQGVATSFIVDGGLTDYHGSIGLHEAGINTRGSTHDAIAYQRTILVSRLEGRVSYPPKSDISGVHTGSYSESFVNPEPDRAPEINVKVDAITAEETGVSGVRRQMIFDYAGTGSDHRMLQLHIRPSTRFEFTTSALTEIWVRGGNLEANGQAAHANAFICIPAGTQVQISSPFGALLIVWAGGPADNAPASLLGF